MGEIRWHPNRYAAARVTVLNNTSDDYSNVQLIVHSELPIMEMTEEYGAVDCSILPAEDLSQMGHIGEYVTRKFTLKLRGTNGQDYETTEPPSEPWPKHLIAADKDYKINCDKIPSLARFVLLAAITSNSGTRPDPPKRIAVEAKYTANGRRISKQIGFDCVIGACTIQRSWWRKRLDALSHWDCDV